MSNRKLISLKSKQKVRKIRGYSSNPRLARVIDNQNPIDTNEQKKIHNKGLFFGLSTTDILLFYITMQANYQLSDYNYYPNIVTYYEKTGKTIKTEQSSEEKPLIRSRFQQSDLDSYPYNCLGLVVGRSQLNNQQIQKIGTACLVAANLLLTSASLVVEETTGQPFKSLTFYPKLNGNIQYTAVQELQVMDLRVTKHFLTSLKLQQNYINQDFALVLLKKPVYRERYILIGYDTVTSSKPKIIGHEIGLVQLSLQKYLKQTGIKGKLIQIDNEIYTHNITSRKLYGGAPIMIEQAQGLIFAIGIHSSNSSRQNYACKITASKAQILKKWAKQLTNNTYRLTIVKMMNNEIKVCQKQNDNASIEEQICQIQKETNKLRENGQKDELRLALGRLGQLCWRNGEFKRSIQYLQEGLQICNQLYKHQSLQSASFYSNLGLNYEKLKNYQLALNNFKLSLKINKKIKGGESLGVAVAYNNLGNLFKRKKNYQKALNYYQKSLAIKKKVDGDKSEGVAASLSNIALIQYLRKEYVQAIKKYKESLSIYQCIFGQSHLQISRTLYNLALCYFDMLQYGQWLDKHFQSLMILQQLHLDNHPSYLSRKQKFITNLLAMIKKSQCDAQLIIKAVKMVKNISADGQQLELTQKLFKKLQSTQ